MDFSSSAIAPRDVDWSSSPDPLSLCDENFPTPSPTKSRRSSVSPRKALVNTSGNTAVQDFLVCASTPTKSRSKGNQQDRSSPWRIRLTVQADQLDGIGTFDIHEGVAGKLQERTTTTRVPLKGTADDSLNVVGRSRQRRRNSNCGTVQRNGTPKPKAERKRISASEASKDPEDDHYQEVTPTRRIKKQLRTNDSSPSAKAYQQTMPDGKEVEKRIRRSRSKGRRKEISPVRLDEALDSSEALNQLSALNQQGLQGHKRTQLELTTSCLSSSDLDLRIQVPDARPEVNGTKEMFAQTSNTYDHGTDNILNDGAHSQDTMGDPCNEHMEFDSVLESEGFSMVSISSLPSTGLQSATLEEENEEPSQRSEASLESNNDKNASSMLQPTDKYSDISSIGQDRTPFNFASPSLRGMFESAKTPAAVQCSKEPSAPRFAAASQTRRPFGYQGNQDQKFEEIVRAGNALQNVTNLTEIQRPSSTGHHTDRKLQSSTNTDQPLSSSPKALQASKLSHGRPSQDLFVGFDGTTRRELRAGLRLGEELAKRQLKSSSLSAVTQGKESENDAAIFAPTLSRSESEDQEMECRSNQKSDICYPELPPQQLPSPARTLSENDEDHMTWKSDGIEQPMIPVVPVEPEISAQPSSPPLIDRTMMAKEAEWQREREAVSKQIEMANSSKVIVIDSDDSSIVLSDGEQQSQSQASEKSSVNESPASALSVKPEVPKLRRSKIPSPWRRGVDTTDKATPATSDLSLFWQPDPDQMKATRRRYERKRKAVDPPLSTTIRVPLNDLDTFRDSSTSSASSTHADESNNNSVLTSNDGSVESTERSTELALEADPEPGETRYISQDVVDEGLQSYDDDSTSTGKTESSCMDPALVQSHPASTFQSQSLTPSMDSAAVTQPSSWLAALTKPLTSLFSSNASTCSASETKPSTLPPATESDILSSSVAVPLSSYHPWTLRHFHALEPLYYAAHLYGAFIFPFDASSPAAPLLGTNVRTSTGWERKVNEMDCGVADAFMFLLSQRSQMSCTTRSTKKGGPRTSVTTTTEASDSQTRSRIDSQHVIKMCVRIWADMVQRGDVELQADRGEKPGLREKGDRIWKKEDVRKGDCRKEYFNRKKKEWGGLPSWREKGLI